MTIKFYSSIFAVCAIGIAQAGPMMTEWGERVTSENAWLTAKQFTDAVKAKALGQNVMTAVRPGQLMVKITHDELTALMGGETADVNLKGNPAIILLISRDVYFTTH